MRCRGGVKLLGVVTCEWSGARGAWRVGSGQWTVDYGQCGRQQTMNAREEQRRTERTENSAVHCVHRPLSTQPPHPRRLPRRACTHSNTRSTTLHWPPRYTVPSILSYTTHTDTHTQTNTDIHRQHSAPHSSLHIRHIASTAAADFAAFSLSPLSASTALLNCLTLALRWSPR